MPTKRSRTSRSSSKSSSKTSRQSRRKMKRSETEAICCRCESKIDKHEKALGGTYNGVVCLNHRSCMSCWFDETSIRGARMQETNKTKNIGLVDKPFKGMKPICPGCRKGLPPFELKKTVTPVQYYEKDNIIFFSDSK